MIEALGLLSYEPREASFDGDLEKLLGELCDYAYEHGLIEHNSVVYRDLFDMQLMGLLTPPPSVVIHHFHELYKKSPLIATDDYYRFRTTNYIRTQRVAKDIKWVTKTVDMFLRSNLSKPEKYDSKSHCGCQKCTASRISEMSVVRRKRRIQWTRQRTCNVRITELFRSISVKNIGICNIPPMFFMIMSIVSHFPDNTPRCPSDVGRSKKCLTLLHCSPIILSVPMRGLAHCWDHIKS